MVKSSSTFLSLSIPLSGIQANRALRVVSHSFSLFLPYYKKGNLQDVIAANAVSTSEQSSLIPVVAGDLR